jgi:anti-anti-sigma regulatory factor
MNSQNLEATTNGSTTIDVLDGPEGALLLKFKGSIDQTNPGEFMDPMLDRVHERVLANKVPHVIADFTELQFCNSSGIKALINWVMKQMDRRRRID